MEHPIPNPCIKTLKIFPGTIVKVSGRPRPNATRFAVNFQTGPSINPRDDLALHLSPCFTPPRIVRNTLRNGNWDFEESYGNGISPHQPFEIMILAEQEQFKIAINGVHFCDFRHRIPYQEITHLTIDGDVDIDKIDISSSSYQQPAYQPSAPAYPGIQPPTSGYPGYPPGNSFMPPMPAGSGQYPMPAAGGAYPMPSGGVSGSYPMPATGGSPYPMPTPSVTSTGPTPYPANYGGGHNQPPHMGGPNPSSSSYQGYPGVSRHLFFASYHMFD